MVRKFNWFGGWWWRSSTRIQTCKLRSKRGQASRKDDKFVLQHSAHLSSNRSSTGERKQNVPAAWRSTAAGQTRIDLSECLDGDWGHVQRSNDTENQCKIVAFSREKRFNLVELFRLKPNFLRTQQLLPTLQQLVKPTWIRCRALNCSQRHHRNEL